MYQPRADTPNLLVWKSNSEEMIETNASERYELPANNALARVYFESFFWLRQSEKFPF